ncbi:MULTISPECIES: lysophospholipid acyltransferase family protein [Prevotellaceae]|jgi:KDO2-lipid IV(A) lauroyltransferase|uniref:Acetyltransferase n=1 Tax=Xylanibacter rarus TaxID=1676614 RepID=A0A8E1QZ18_9BACT|nr:MULTISPECIES: lysophospholipid acyltransferase family protein [Prevotellaceae]KOO69480.1 acetyltransferase [Xylanibacter rarus]CCX69962.1 lauroyl/myristoyl acyltransferase [Prevotella sp. CAG:255]HJH75953.1 lysophospholipid acyltransferase family protein [Prevotellaceae bacterium]
MKEFLYNIIYGIFYLVSKLPYRALYVISDIANLVLYHIVRYRRDIVRRNITSAFPEKSLEECISIERGFYKWFCDYFVETVKLMSVSRQELLSRIEFRGIDKIEECFDRGQTCAGILGHYGNWELLSATGLVIKKHPEAVIGLIYHPLRSQLFDRLFINMRQSMGGVCVPKKDILRYLVSFRSQNLMNLFGYIADQAPRYRNIHLWLPFLNHDTPVFTGAERIMRKMNNAVFYIDVERPERGKYIYTFKLMTDKPGEMPEFEITKKFFVMLEQTIRREPRFYLWSHNRWKRTREEFDKEFKIENGHVVRK